MNSTLLILLTCLIVGYVNLADAKFEKLYPGLKLKQVCIKADGGTTGHKNVKVKKAKNFKNCAKVCMKMKAKKSQIDSLMFDVITKKCYCTAGATGSSSKSNREYCIFKQWAAWDEWTTGECSASCGGGTVKSTRKCEPGLGDCEGDAEKMEACNKGECETEDPWCSDWVQATQPVDEPEDHLAGEFDTREECAEACRKMNEKNPLINGMAYGAEGELAGYCICYEGIKGVVGGWDETLGDDDEDTNVLWCIVPEEPPILIDITLKFDMDFSDELNDPSSNTYMKTAAKFTDGFKQLLSSTSGRVADDVELNWRFTEGSVVGTLKYVPVSGMESAEDAQQQLASVDTSSIIGMQSFSVEKPKEIGDLWCDEDDWVKAQRPVEEPNELVIGPVDTQDECVTACMRESANNPLINAVAYAAEGPFAGYCICYEGVTGFVGEWVTPLEEGDNNILYCKNPASWGEWKDGECSVTCGEGTMTQTRECSTGKRENCYGEHERQEACNKGSCEYYLVSPTTYNYEGALAYCESKGMQLATTGVKTMASRKSIQENTQGMCRTNCKFWVGLNKLKDGKVWRWLDDKEGGTKKDMLWFYASNISNKSRKCAYMVGDKTVKNLKLDNWFACSYKNIYALCEGEKSDNTPVPIRLDG